MTVTTEPGTVTITRPRARSVATHRGLLAKLPSEGIVAPTAKAAASSLIPCGQIRLSGLRSAPVKG